MLVPFLEAQIKHKLTVVGLLTYLFYNTPSQIGVEMNSRASIQWFSCHTK